MNKWCVATRIGGGARMCCFADWLPFIHLSRFGVSHLTRAVLARMFGVPEFQKMRTKCVSHIAESHFGNGLGSFV